MATKLALRIASRFLAGEEPDDAAAPEEHTSFVPTGPSLKMFEDQVDDVVKAMEEENHKLFDQSMDKLVGNWGKYKNKGWGEKDEEERKKGAKEQQDWLRS